MTVVAICVQSPGCGAQARIGRVAARVGAARWFHSSRGGSPTAVNSVVVITSIRSDVDTESSGHQLWQWERSEPTSIDGDVDRWWISRGIPSIASDAAVANWPVILLLARGQIRAWVARRASGRSVSSRLDLCCVCASQNRFSALSNDVRISGREQRQQPRHLDDRECSQGPLDPTQQQSFCKRR